MILFKTTRLLSSTKVWLEKSPDDYEFPIASFFHFFGFGVFEMRKQYGRDYEVKPYLLSTPHIRHLSQSMATTFIYQRENLEKFVSSTKLDLTFKPYSRSASRLGYIRSGMDFFFTSFEDVPVSIGKEFVPFSQYYNAVAVDLVDSFDFSMNFFVNNFRFKFSDNIPSNIPSSHWWWIKKIKNRTDISDLYY